ncbi:MAG: pyroglutamyl-peptidase I [Acidobacteriota bacterium]
MMKKLLITAFEPFDGEGINPSLEVARHVAGLKFRGARISALELAVERHRAIDAALNRLRRLQPDAMIMLGEAGERFQITPERIAINCDDFRIPDNAGNQPMDESIIKRGPAAYFSALPVRAIVNRLVESNIPAAISNSAGTYLCNRLFYSVMHCIAKEKLPTKAGFIHLPRLHEQVIGKRGNNPSLARETIIEAVRLSVEVTLDHLRR